MSTVTPRPTSTQPEVGIRQERAVAKSAARLWDTPVAWLALGGAGFLCLEVYVFTAWILSSDFKRVEPGSTPLGSTMKIALVACCASTVLLAVWLLWRFVFKPWRSERQLTVVGCFGLASIFMFWQDPAQNMVMPWFTYNHWLPNMGAWGNQIPWTVEPHATNLADPVYASCTGFILLYFGGMLVGKRVMEWARTRNPDVSTVKLLWLTVIAGTITMGALELAWMQTGFYIYPRVIPSLTLFAGKTYQIPIYEFVIDGVTVAAMSWLVYFRNDKGESLCERGLTSLNYSHKRKSLMRFLAFTCMVNIVFGAYDLVVQPFVLNASSVPKSIASKSYYMGGYCGQGTGMACWNQSLPIPTQNSAKVDPQGKLVRGQDPISKTPPFATKLGGS